MSKTIDERIVEMQFDNRQFESGVKDSLDSLERLKKGLNFDQSVKNLNELSEAGRKFSLEGIAEGVDRIAEKFTTLGIIGVTALQNITNRVIDLGINMAKSLSIDQLSAGFTKYTEKTGSVQSIMNATGKSLEEVNDYLDQLMWFSDETSYSFIDMTAALAQMTSSGGKVEKLIPLITGVANATAYAGKGTAEFSRAMYNLNQSYGSGFLTYMDWRSLELAGVASEQLKKVFIDTAIAMGKLKKDGKTAKGTLVTVANFGSTLNEKWADTAVMEAAFGRFSELSQAAYEAVKAGEYETAADAIAALSEKYDELSVKAFKSAQQAKSFSEAIEATKDAVSSGWMKTFEIIFGNFEEATVFWTDVTNTLWDIFASGAEARNEMLEAWKDAGGRDDLIESLWNTVEAIERIITPIKEAFREFFPKITVEQLVQITKNLKEFTERIKIGDETSDKLRRTFAGLFAVLDLVREGFKFVSNVAKELFTTFGLPAASKILDVSANLGDFLVKVNESVKQSNFFSNALTKIKETFTVISEGISSAIETIKNAINKFRTINTDPLKEFSDKTEQRLNPISNIAKIFKSIFDIIIKVFEWATPIVVRLGSIAGDALGKFADKLSNFAKNLEFDEILDLVNTGLFSGILIGINSFVNKLNKTLFAKYSGLLSNVANILDTVKYSLISYQNSIRANTILKIAGAVAILAGAVAVLTTLDSEKLTTALLAITQLFVELTAATTILGKLLMDKGMVKVSTTIVAMSAAILILSFALKNLADLDWEGIGKGAVGITVLTAAVITSANSLSKIKGKAMKGSVGLIAFGAALVIMVQAVKQLAAIDLENLLQGMVAFTVLIAEVVAAAHLMKTTGNMVSTGVGLIAFATAMLIFTKAFKSLSDIEWESIAKGFTSFLGILVPVTAALKVLGGGNFGKGTGLILVATSMLIFGEAFQRLSGFEWEAIGKAATSFAAILGTVTAALALMGNGVFAKATGLVVLASSMLIFGEAFKKVSDLEWESIGKGVASFVAILGTAVLALTLMPSQKIFAQAMALVAIATALTIMVAPMRELGKLSLAEIGKGLLSIAGIFAILGGAAALLGPLIPTILALAGAIALLGVGVGLAGVGVLALSTGLATLGVSASAVAGSIVIIGSALLSLIPIIFEKLGEGIIALGRVIINGAPIIKEAFVSLISSGAEALLETAPMIVDTLLTLLISLLTALDEKLPEVVDKLFSVVTQFLEKVAEKLPDLIKAGAKLLGAFLEGIFDAMGGYQPENLFNMLSCISMLVVSFTILAAAKKFAKDAIIAAGAMAAVMVIIAGVFALISVLPIDNVLDIAQSLSIVLLSMSAALGILSLIPIPAALSALGSLAIFVGGLSGLLAVLGGLAQIPGLEWLINEGADFLQTIGNSLGKFVGGIIGGFGEGLSDSLPAIGENLSAFMAAASPFIEGVKNVDESAMNGVRALAETVLILTAASFLDGINAWFSGKGSSLKDFGKEITEFAPYFIDYYRQIKDVDGSVVEGSANAAKALSEMANGLPKKGGVAAWFAGENSLSDFAEELSIFGPKLKAYADSVKGLDSDIVVNSVNATKAMSELAKGLPNQGGVVSWFTGDNTLSKFGEEISEFAPYLKEYAEQLGGLDGQVVINSAKAAQALAELIHSLPNQGGVVSWFTGDNTLSKFGEELSKFGEYFAEYYENAINIDGTKTLGTTSAIRAIVQVAKDISSSDISGLSNFAQTLTTQADLGVQGFTDAFRLSDTKIKSSISQMFSHITTAITKKIPELVAKMKSVVADMLRTIRDNVYLFRQAGKDLVDGVLLGMQEKHADATKAADILAKKILNQFKQTLEIKSPSKVMKDEVGNYIVEGIAEGIKSNMSAEEAAAKKAQNIVNAFKTELDKADLKSTTSSLEQKLWEAMYGDTASSSELLATKMSFLGQRIGYQQEKVDLSKGKYETMLREFGAESEKTREAYNEYLNAQISLVEMNKEYNQLVETNNQLNEDLFTSKGEAMAKYAEIMATYGEQLEKSGFTKEEIEAWAREASGLDKLNQNGSQKALVQDIKNSADAAFSTVETVYQKELNSIFGQNVVNTFTGYGETYAKAIGEGFIKSFKNVLASIKDAFKTLRNEIQIELEYILSHIKSVLNEELELTVTIRPVLDMSDIGYGPLGSLVADALTVDVSESRNRALQVASYPNSGSETGATSNQPNSVYFVQNNYSPKALSRIDIYRQTKNQISTLKELVNA